MFLRLVEAGLADRLLRSSDFAMGAALEHRGGARPAQSSTVLGPTLLEAGLDPATLRSIAVIDNPRRFLAFVPI